MIDCHLAELERDQHATPVPLARVSWLRRGYLVAHAFPAGESRSLCGQLPLSVARSAPEGWQRCRLCAAADKRRGADTKERP